jgi:hypothetical protein
MQIPGVGAEVAAPVHLWLVGGSTKIKEGPSAAQPRAVPPERRLESDFDKLYAVALFTPLTPLA